MNEAAAAFVWHDPLVITEEQCVEVAQAMNQAIQDAFDMIATILRIPALRDPLGPNYFNPSDAREFLENPSIAAR